MGTRSRIGVMHGDTCKSVYCHWDGYLAYNGAILQEHYDSAKANYLVALGDISSLGKSIGEQHPFSKFDIKGDEPDAEAKLKLMEQAEAEGWTTFYGRDRGEEGTDFAVDFTFSKFLERVDACGAEYYYIMKDGVWYTGCPNKGDKMVTLAEALEFDRQNEDA